MRILLYYHLLVRKLVRINYLKLTLVFWVLFLKIVLILWQTDAGLHHSLRGLRLNIDLLVWKRCEWTMLHAKRLQLFYSWACYQLRVHLRRIVVVVIHEVVRVLVRMVDRCRFWVTAFINWSALIQNKLRLYFDIWQMHLVSWGIVGRLLYELWKAVLNLIGTRGRSVVVTRWRRLVVTIGFELLLKLV